MLLYTSRYLGLSLPPSLSVYIYIYIHMFMYIYIYIYDTTCNDGPGPLAQEGPREKKLAFAMSSRFHDLLGSLAEEHAFLVNNKDDVIDKLPGWVCIVVCDGTFDTVAVAAGRDVIGYKALDFCVVQYD